MTWNRNGGRLRNILASLLVHQTVKPLEVVVVDTSSKTGIAERNEETVGKFEDVVYIARPSKIFNKCHALNIGIKTTRSEAEFVMCTDVDEMFSRTFLETALRLLKERDNIFLLSEVGFLKQDVSLRDPFLDGNWKQLCESISGRGWASGTIQATKRDWWFKVHGYDERFSGGLGHMDSDLGNRAHKDGLKTRCVRFVQAQALHQWHPKSRMKVTTQKYYSGANPVVANLNGWGK